MTRTTARMDVERKGALQEHVHSGRSSGAVDSDLVAELVSSGSGLGCHFRILLSLAVLIAPAFAWLLVLGSTMDLESMPLRLNVSGDEMAQDQVTDTLGHIEKMTDSEEAARLLKSLLQSKRKLHRTPSIDLKPCCNCLEMRSRQKSFLRQLMLEGFLDESTRNKFRAFELKQAHASYSEIADEVHEMFSSVTKLWVNESNESHQSARSTNMSLALWNQDHAIETSRRLSGDSKPCYFDIILHRFLLLRNHNFRLFPVFRRRPFCFSITILALLGILSVLGCMVPGGMHGVGRSHGAQHGMHGHPQPRNLCTCRRRWTAISGNSHVESASQLEC